LLAIVNAFFVILLLINIKRAIIYAMENIWRKIYEKSK